MIEVHAEFPQREVIQANAVVDNEEKTVSEVIISAKPEITGVTASVDNDTGTPYVDVTETGTGTDFSFNLAFHNLKGDKGEQGETGQTGNGIVSITKTATVGLEDDYTINFTNGTQTVYTVTNGADGQDGTDGTDGQDGFSPIATVEPIQDGAKITITDKDGTTTTNVYNGTDGQNGVDGQAATITVGSTTTGQAGTSASVVNSGTSSAAILDFTIPKGDKGDTGNTGATGQDGFSPTATVTQSGGITTISITDKNGTTTESIDLSSYATQTDLTNGLATKQDTLIAGTDLEIIPAQAPILPEGFTQIEYIEGTGTQYIDTGYYGTQNSGAYIRFALTDLTSEGSARVFGTRNGTAGTKAFAFISSYDGSSLPSDKFYIGSNGYASWPTNLDTNWHEVSCNIENDKKVYFDGNLIITGSNTAYTSTAQASIFRRYNQNTYSGKSATAKISILQIYENAVMVHNFIPCRRDSDDELGMYDLVSDTFFTNSGTGTFIAGADVIFPETDLINFTNASGYTTNVGTVTSVNNIQPDANGDVTLTIPTVNDGILTITQNGTSKGTFSANQSTNDTIALTDTTYNNFTGADGTNAGSSGLVPAPSATDNDKYLKGDGTWASVSSGSSTDVQINSTSITSQGVANIVTNSAYDASSNKIATMSDVPSISGLADTDLSNLSSTGEAHFLKNRSSDADSIAIGSSNSASSAINIGYLSNCGDYSIAIGGYNNRHCSIMLGTGYINKDYSFDVGINDYNMYDGIGQVTYQMLDLKTGLIPDARISTNIARTSQIPSTSGLANTSLSNLSSTGKKVIDGQWVAKETSLTTSTAINTYTLDLVNYLPSGGGKYEVLVACNISSNKTSPSNTRLYSDVISISTNYLNQKTPNTSHSLQAGCLVILPVTRYLYFKIENSATASTTIIAEGYRRIGTNT